MGELVFETSTQSHWTRLFGMSTKTTYDLKLLVCELEDLDTMGFYYRSSIHIDKFKFTEFILPFKSRSNVIGIKFTSN